VSFFDEGDEPRTAVTRPRARRPGDARTRSGADDRTLLVRRGGAALVIVILIVIAVLGVKAILNSQANQALRDYVTKVDGLLSTEHSQVKQFFAQLDNAYNASNPAAVTGNIQQTVVQEQQDYRNAEGWSVPSQVAGAQRTLVLALGLRYQGLQQIDAKISAALGVGSQVPAIEAITGAMELLSASDVLYAERTRPLILEALATAGITDVTVPANSFLPDNGWLAPQTTAQRILGYVPVTLGGTTAASGAYGHELVGVSGPKGGLSTTADNVFALGSGGVSFTLQVLNSGTAVAHGEITKITFHSASVRASCLDVRSTIPQTVPGTTYQSTLVVNATSTCDSFYNAPLTMIAEAQPLPGETDRTNNYKHYLVEFTKG
jgi:hypothetical protein